MTRLPITCIKIIVTLSETHNPFPNTSLHIQATYNDNTTLCVGYAPGFVLGPPTSIWYSPCLCGLEFGVQSCEDGEHSRWYFSSQISINDPCPWILFGESLKSSPFRGTAPYRRYSPVLDMRQKHFEWSQRDSPVLECYEGPVLIPNHIHMPTQLFKKKQNE